MHVLHTLVHPRIKFLNASQKLKHVDRISSVSCLLVVTEVESANTLQMNERTLATSKQHAQVERASQQASVEKRGKYQ